MDQQQIKAFIDAMAATDLAEMEFSQDGWSLRLVRRPGSATITPATALTPSAGAAGPVPAPPNNGVDAFDAVDAVGSAPAPSLLRAPLYGVVHFSPAPGEPAFVTVGQAVAAGQILCVIEAMKVFNEVRAQADATVAEILVGAGQEVDAAQPLLRFA
jgi:acetyl-CoA carboxylase biotin carboxyl carrier protein